MIVKFLVNVVLEKFVILNKEKYPFPYQNKICTNRNTKSFGKIAQNDKKAIR
ncbi:MAG: hypothetical protein KBB29_07990 [Bacteroidales bacterium]|nr:hypothetical protein [Bacteroidales bacterium]HNT41819.1 hypothetical protein [Tenuifilaceae bacterium]MBP8643923.1 hypothetical protein [Bacteroidales bacterium]NLI86623.1 hypothetical protein [Bacteroidales bacterium]HOA10145.1 hypothetical protein [Tenuifilaceae bacterium]